MCGKPLCYLSGEQVDDLKGVFDNADGQQFLAVVASVHHHGVSDTLHDGTLSLTETLGCVSAAGMREVFGIFLLHGNVILTKERNTCSFAQTHSIATDIWVYTASKLSIWSKCYWKMCCMPSDIWFIAYNFLLSQIFFSIIIKNILIQVMVFLSWYLYWILLSKHNFQYEHLVDWSNLDLHHWSYIFRYVQSIKYD